MSTRELEGSWNDILQRVDDLSHTCQHYLHYKNIHKCDLFLIPTQKQQLPFVVVAISIVKADIGNTMSVKKKSE